ncbi:MAG: efflux RND transporter periplasmic adaptor subunit [Piscinibacter sp.]|uniref:efflux RND transporter periplasmic adaptor subunit n=1 Tax=Piscinibacter sp. TaxID=1903157 RepID=UPI00258BC4BA|nr:efflux RND transporter periplasmic adaptor subunit [Piscinibacter sp.]MCW5662374.1 efflux RND transporter periplasmic adaptor subunit [Piscinibacter sp.]
MTTTKNFSLFKPGPLVAALLLTTVAAVPAVLLGLSGGQAEATPAAAAPAGVPVSVATVQASPVAAWDEFSGRLEAVEHVELRSRAAGTVQAVHFREGALVRQGELLFTIDPAPYAAALERVQAQVAAAQARLDHTKNELERAKRLWEERAIAQREFDERHNAWREADAQLRSAQAAEQSARLDLGYTQVRAPIAGRIGRVEVTVGNLVAAGPGAPVLTTLVSVSPIYASFDADEQSVLRALGELRSAGARTAIERIPVQMEIGPRQVEGRLQLIDNQVDTRSGTIRVRAVFDNPDGRLIPGQFAKLRMGQPQAATALLVNERAVGTDQNKRFVMVVGADNKAAWREVKLGGAFNGLRVVTDGLQPGERVVVNGLQRVRPGALLAPKEVAMDAKPEVTAKSAAPKQS